MLSNEAFDTLAPEVVERAITLAVEQRQKNVFYVTGGAEPHWVNLRDTDAPRCDCVDHEARQRLCKHLVAVLIYLGDFRLWMRLRALAGDSQDSPGMAAPSGPTYSPTHGTVGRSWDNLDIEK